MAENWWVILLVLLVVAVALWWLLGSKGASDRSPPAAMPRDDAPADTLTRAAEPASPIVAAPMLAVPVIAPIDVVPVVPIIESAPPAAAGPPDDLLLLKGVGPKLATLLGSLGVTRFDQIAAWTDADIARVDAQLGTFKGRATRDKWVEQSSYLATGDRAGFEAKFGKIEG